MGPRLRDADVPQRFEFDDLELVMNIRAGRTPREGNLCWSWSEDVDRKPGVQLKMSSEVVKRCFQGRENIARRCIKTGGHIKASLALISLTRPIDARYRAMVDEESPHLRI
jgi:hypothetical protein